MIAPPAAGSSVLVVEDNDAVRATLVELLSSNGYEVVAAIDGEQALEMIRSVPAPLGFLVTDMMLPGMTGLEVARAIQERWPACRVLFITGYLDLDAPQRAAARRLAAAEAVLAARAPRRAGQAARRVSVARRATSCRLTPAAAGAIFVAPVIFLTCPTIRTAP